MAEEYEILIEEINPCGGDSRAKRQFIEAEVESPEAFVKSHTTFPILDSGSTPEGDIVITAGDGHGYLQRYVFTK